MACFSLVIEYLTGYAVATDHASRERAEWPPHPARVYMALAAAHFETDGDPSAKQAERDALDWFAGLPSPDMVLPSFHAPREVLTTYVPVNDQASDKAIVQRSRQPRTFPRIYVGQEPVRLIWQTGTDDFPAHIQTLENLCRSVTRIGHSSSLVWARIERTAGDQTPTWVKANADDDPTADDDRNPPCRLRVVSSGTLDRLESLYNRENIEKYAQLEKAIHASKGVAKKKLQQQQAQEFPGGSPTSQRPVISLYQDYRQPKSARALVHESIFDPNFVVLRPTEQATQIFGLESTAGLTKALRGAIQSIFKDEKTPPDWVSGHEPNGDKLQSRSHLALAPLAFVGHRHADGHLMGMAIMIPRDIPLLDRRRVLSKLLFDEQSRLLKPITLTLGESGVWKLIRESSISDKETLKPSTYTNPSRCWASVTPIVLDRMPKTDRMEEPQAWREEVKQIIVASCHHVGLPEPRSVRVEKTPFFIGSLRAMPGQGGFPQLRKDKFQVHAQIEFGCEVAGPMLLGAGRFRGYGLMRPWKEGDR